MIWILIVLVVFLIHVAFYSIFKKPPTPRQSTSFDFILVLGCPTLEDGTLSSFQLRRIEAAQYYYKQGCSNTIIISGGNVKNKHSEAEDMASALRQYCPKANILLERKARNTYQNLKHVKAMIDGTYILVVSGSSHLRRSYFFVRKFYPDALMGCGLKKDPWYAYLWEYTRMWVALYWEIRLKLQKKD